MRTSLRFAAMAMALSGLTAIASAQDGPFLVTMRVQEQSTISKGTATLADIGTVVANRPVDDDRAMVLQRAEVTSGIGPGGKVTMTGEEVLRRIQGGGVSLDRVGYTIPATVTVVRVGRELQRDELQTAVNRYLAGSGREMTVKHMTIEGAKQLFVGASRSEVTSLERERPGMVRIGLRSVDGGGETELLTIIAMVDEFTYVPVAQRSVSPGSVLDQSDLVMARVNTAQLPRDAVVDQAQVVGLEPNRQVAAGTVFREAELRRPSIIAAGAPVTMRATASGFVATATGTALESGVMGASIRVRNDSSKKVVRGKILDSNVVEVTP
jgi:flagella basal body P-ring formation protein FlgA